MSRGGGDDLRPVFLGECRRLEDAAIVVLPIPFEKTTTYLKGCGTGPAAILKASEQVEVFDEELEGNVSTLGIHTALPVASSAPTPEAMILEVEQAVGNFLDREKFLVGIGGEHTITVGIVKAFLKKFPNLGVLQLDAHGDLRHTYHGSLLNHACVARRIREMAPLLHVGLRSLSEEEAGKIRELQIPVVGARRFLSDPQAALKALSELPDQVYLTIDMDFFDPSEVPGVGTPEPGGPRWYETLEFLRETTRRKKIVGFDVMELCPRPGEVTSDFYAAKLVYRILAYIHLPH